MMNMKTKEKGCMALVVLSFFIFCTAFTMAIIPVSASEISPPEPELLWKYDTGERIRSITVADLGGDGEKDVVIEGRMYFHTILNSSGSLLWKYPRNFTLAIGDIDGDGINDFVLGARDGFTYAIKSNGSILWEYETNITYEVYAADINGDGIDDVVACSIDDNVYAIKNDGSLLWKHKVAFRTYRVCSWIR
jgi:outer membrane protein assembly factor BamB